MVELILPTFRINFDVGSNNSTFKGIEDFNFRFSLIINWL